MENWYGIQSALLAAVICAALAVNVLLRGRRPVTYRRFALFNLNLVAWFLSAALSLSGALGPRWSVAVQGAMASLLPSTAVGFFVSFSADKSRLAAAARRSAQGLTLLLLAAHVMAWPEPEEIRQGGLFGALLATLAVSVALMTRRYLALERRVDRARLKYLIVTGAAVFGVVLFGQLPTVRLATLGNILVAFYMFFVFQVITRRRVLDVFEFLGRFVVLGGFAIVLSLIYVVLVGWWRIDFGLFVFNTTIATIVVLILYDPLRNLVEEKLNQLVFREKFEFTRRIEVLRRALNSIIDVQDLADTLLESLQSSRRVTHASLYLFQEDGLSYSCLGAIGTATPSRLDAIKARPFLTRLQDEKLLAIENLEAERDELLGRGNLEDQGQIEMLEAVAETMGELQAALSVGFISGEQLLGFISVKDERLREAYSTDELRALVALAGQVTITIENSRLFARMRERDRLAALGEMAAGLAHEIRNPLGSIKGAAQLISEGGVTDEPYLGIISEEVDRLDGVVSQFLSYARPLKGSHDLIDVNTVLERTLTLLRATDHPCTIEHLAAPNLPAIRSDPEILRQVVLNLARNAIEAMGEAGGKLVISTALARRRALATAAGSAGADRITFVRVRFEDTGPGIPPEVMERLFIPFYTTKPNGTGLGLAICQRIVRSLGGTIEVSSRVDSGTTFTIYLPAHDPTSRSTTA